MQTTPFERPNQAPGVQSLPDESEKGGESNMKENNLTPLEIYINKVFKLLIVLIPSIALCAGLTFTALHLLGYYPDVAVSTMVLFDISCLGYTSIGLVFNRRCENEEGMIRPDILKKGKIFIAIMEFIQWNFISFMIPSRDFWAYSFFFVLLAAFFLDSKFIMIITAEVVGSMLICWMIRPEEMLPVADALFVPEMALRGVLIVLCFGTIWLLTLTIEKRLAKELEKISDFDTLTLLYNRRKLGKYFDNAAVQWKKGGQFSVIMADIDDFKQVNDTHGHSCGDEVLKDIASIIRNVSESKGLPFRYGGEEILVLVYAGEGEAVCLAEKIRQRVETHSTVFEAGTVNVTMTLGVAAYSDADTLESLIKRADANLYYGKNHGKNCVIK